MKRLKSVLSAGCGLCLLLTGCGQPAQAVSSVSTGAAHETASQMQTPPDEHLIASSSASGDAADQIVQGKTRITYTGNESTVRYITAASQLPDNEELDKYDDAYFQDHALVLVTESVNSGSIDVAIDSIRQTDQGNVVVLRRSFPAGSQAGTSDMATWLLWAEVDAGMEGEWSVENPALPSSAVKY